MEVFEPKIPNPTNVKRAQGDTLQAKRAVGSQRFCAL